MSEGYVDNGGMPLFPWQFTAKLCINEAARFDATNVKNGPDQYDRTRIEMAMIDHTRNGSISATCTNDERSAFHMGARA
jgi:hypothetical protein